MKVTVITIVIGVIGMVTKGFGKGSGRVGNWRKNRDHPNNNINKNTEKSPGGLKRLAITQTTKKNHQLTLVGKTPQE